LEEELQKNKSLIKQTQGNEDGESSGSDSEPSADNLDEEEMAELVPEHKKKKEKPVPKKPEVKKEPPKSPIVKARPVVKEITRTAKKTNVYNPFDRLNLKKRRPEMKDAWT
jgi:hypothetical protein